MFFGFVLSRVGATDYDAINGMFMLTDLHLYGVIGTAVAVSALGFAYVRRRKVRSAGGVPLAIVAKPMQPGVIWGGLLFGAGWALTGTCPGTALAQLGEGTMGGGITILGILAGAYLRSLVDRRRSLAPPSPRNAEAATA
jgi:hypothetical protein